MNHVPIILLAFGAGLACGGWAMWLLMRAGEKRLEAQINSLVSVRDSLAGRNKELLQDVDVLGAKVMADAAKRVFDSSVHRCANYDVWLFCDRCNHVFVSEGGRMRWSCLCHTAYSKEQNLATWQRVRVTARRIGQ